MYASGLVVCRLLEMVLIAAGFLFRLGFKFPFQFGLDFIFCREATVPEFPVLLDFLFEHFLPDETLHQFLMFAGRVESCEYFHHIVDFLLGFGPRFLDFHLFVQIEDVPAEDELFLAIALRQSLVVGFQDLKFHLLGFRGVVVGELHFRQH